MLSGEDWDLFHQRRYGVRCVSDAFFQSWAVAFHAIPDTISQYRVCRHEKLPVEFEKSLN